MIRQKLWVAAAGALVLAGCASVPTGPSVMALPGTSKTFDQFRYDDASCRDYALVQIGGASASQSANNAAVRSAAVGTAIGAVAGAAIGGHEGAGAGAGTGLIMGSMAGAGAADASAYGSQQRYDNAYIQCMYAKGERVPVPASMAGRDSLQQQGVQAQQRTPTSPPPPPPPPGY